MLSHWSKSSMSTRRRHLVSIILKILWIKGFVLKPVEIYSDLVFAWVINTKKISFLWMYFKRPKPFQAGISITSNITYIILKIQRWTQNFVERIPSFFFFGSMIIMNVVQNFIKHWYGHFDIVHIGINGNVHRSFSWLKKQNLKIRKILYWKIISILQKKP